MWWCGGVRLQHQRTCTNLPNPAACRWMLQLAIQPPIKGNPHLHLPTHAVMEEPKGRAPGPARCCCYCSGNGTPPPSPLPAPAGKGAAAGTGRASFCLVRGQQQHLASITSRSRPWARPRGRTRSARACRAGRRAPWTSRCCRQALHGCRQRWSSARAPAGSSALVGCRGLSLHCLSRKQ